MKIIHISLALLAAGFLGSSAFADNNNNNSCSCQTPLSLAVTQNGHGQLHFMYFQVSPDNASVALSTSSGGVTGFAGTMQEQDRPLPDGGNVRYVIGTNQHGQPMASNILISSHFAPAGQ
jgi:hypothetical protein